MRTRAWRSHLPTAWSLLIALLVLGPALGRGFVLSYDMVWVPDLALRQDSFGLSPALPRAVPSDAVVAVLDEVVPGEPLQKLVLIAILVLAGTGIAQLARYCGLGPVGALVAVSVYVWNPFVAERLWIGHWPLLMGYAALPWILTAAARHRRDEAGWSPLALWLPLGSLSPTAGLVTAIAVLAAGARGRGPAPAIRHNLRLTLMVLAANAPWLVAGALHAGSATSLDASVFSVHGEGRMPVVLTVLGLGGIWNSEVVPASRETVWAWISLLGLAVLASVGARSWWRRSRQTVAIPLLVCWTIGITLALLPAALPGLLDAAAETLPGAGLLRDSGRLLALCAPLLAVLVAFGAEVGVRQISGRPSRVALVVALSLFPLMVLPDLAWGVGGALRPVSYPASFSDAREVLATAEQRRPGDVLILPFTSYRAPEWNGGRKVFAPLGRVLTPNDVTSDDLVVDGRMIPGEDPRGELVRAALQLPDPAERSRALSELGIQYAAADAPAGVDLAGTRLVASEAVVVTTLEETAVPRISPWSWRLALTVAWLVWTGVVITGAVATLTRRRRRGDVGVRRTRW